ncbi:peptide-methionine (S)-S-oxide reductase MsrA [Azonexus fungiphilus]|uniref:peptide-methionine (S)-S-oxide reductase MsrA n=1 Tax=Azonexus fungiphilus TaxID=146940 RepID=UPI00156ACF47|nr:peptide-methionine (S)-S-oxide reductase MsrA [Azonexus fungiphilus]NHC05582.1 peptide-methionine (S)-S-oxide reductase MsrA [Azonexus fungiphilus]
MSVQRLFCGLVAALCSTLAGAAPPATESIVLGMGCFWGAEKRMAELPGVVDVESGYANGEISGSYNAVLALEKAIRAGQSRKRNHAEVVRVRFDPARTSLEKVLARFWESHDPTQGDRQGNDVGSNYRSAIYTTSEAQQAVALKTRDVYQKALSAAGRGRITTEIAPLKAYFRAEDYHQDYLVKNPDGYCGLGGTGVKYPGGEATPTAKAPARARPLDGARLNQQRQLVVFEAEDCAYCRQFKAEVLDHWKSPAPVVRTLAPEAPSGWTLEKPLFATPTIVLFEKGREVSRYTGYNGDQARFWKWLGFHLLTPAQQKIAFEQGTERPGTGSHLDEKRPGTFVDPITGAALFRSDTKFDSGTGWPSFFNPLPGSITLHEDVSHGMRRVEVRSASSGIHLGHVFDDGPPPTGKRYCINGNVLKFVPDSGK